MLKKIDFTTKQKSGPGSKVDFEVFLQSIAIYMYMFIETLLIIMDSTSAWFISSKWHFSDDVNNYEVWRRVHKCKLGVYHYLPITNRS